MTSRRVYVAGASREIGRARAAMEAIRAAGHTITFDWTLDSERYGSDGPGLDEADLVRCAGSDLAGIRSASSMLVLWPRASSIGVFVELGYAMGLGGPEIVVSGGDRLWCSLLRNKSALGHRAFATDSDAVAHVIGSRRCAPTSR